MYFWYGFVFIWDGIGMWTSAFGTLYATLLPRLFIHAPSGNRFMKAFLHPLSLNFFCFFPPFVLLVTQVITSTYSAVAWSNLVHTQFGLVGDLVTLASQWTASGGQAYDEGLLTQTVELGTLFLAQQGRSLAAFKRNAATCE
jgi:hypothetical protein